MHGCHHGGHELQYVEQKMFVIAPHTKKGIYNSKKRKGRARAKEIEWVLMCLSVCISVLKKKKTESDKKREQ